MMSARISNTIIASSYTLTAAYTTITNTGAVASPSGTAVNGGVGTSWTVANAGTVSAAGGTGAVGISLASGVVSNTASIAGGSYGIFFGTGAGTVDNAGTITSTVAMGVYFYASGVVTNTASGLIDAHAVGIYNLNGSTTVDNAGRIIGARAGVYMGLGGTVTNAAAATISGRYEGVRIANADATLTNAGSISSSFGPAILIAANGLITNAASASIVGGSAASAIRVVSGVGTVVNSGTISGTANAGIYLLAGGTVSNAAAAAIQGGILGGVYMTRGAGLVDNAGTIAGAGTAGIDVSLAAGFANRVIDHPGAVFTGIVDGGNTIGASVASTLELASAASAGTLTGLGTGFVDFADVAIDAGAAWTIGGTASGVSAGATISGFSALDTIDITDIAATGSLAAGLGAHNVLDVTQNGGTIATIQLDPAQDFTGQHFHPGSDGAAGIAITMACFAAGTRIATGAGEVAVERLSAGQMIRSAFGGVVPVVWIGHRRVDCRRHPRPHDVWPVCIAAGAFGAGRPARDLRLSPDHAIHHDGALIPVRYLVNGGTVTQEPVDIITYYHVELPAHDVLFAEGLPAESYLDTGNRSAFANAPQSVDLRPDFALRVWHSEGCAPLATEGPAVLSCRAMLRDRAATLGFGLTGDPAFAVLADGRPLAADISNRSWHVALPAGAQELRLVSRRWVPAHVDSTSTDHRVLGVALAGLMLDGEAIGPRDPRCGAGWHEAESDFRWTRGDATLLATGARRLRFHVVSTGRYWLRPSRAARWPAMAV
jgi:hypothetical protein